jgi:large conductance mechanosensitive channel
MLKGFKDFLLRGNIIDLAVAFVMGVAFQAVVKAFSDDFIGGILGAIGGTPNFGNAGVTVNGSKIVYGTTLTALISFIVTAAVIYYVVVVPVARLIKKDEESGPSETDLLTEIRDLLARQARP